MQIKLKREENGKLPICFSFVGIFLLLFILCVVPLLTNYMDSLTHTVETSAWGEVIPLSQETIIQQQIPLEGELKHLKLFLTTESDIAEDALLHFQFTNADQIGEMILPLADIGSDNLALYEVRLPHMKWQKGKMLLEISVESSVDFIGAYLWAKNDTVSGVPAVQINGTVANGPLSLSFEISKHPPLFVYKTMMLLFLIILCIGTAVFLSWKKDWLEHHNWILVGLAFCIIVVVSGIRQPSNSFFAEPLYEQVNQFWKVQHDYGFLGSLMQLECGLYLSWLQRIGVAFSQVFFPEKYAFVGMHVFSLGFVAATSAAFCMKKFERFWTQLERLIFALFCGIFLGYGYIVFHCVGYWGIFFILWVCTYCDMEQMPKWLYWVSICGTIIVCLSKLLYVSLLLPAFFLLLVTLQEKRPRFKFYWFVVAGACIFHIVYVFLVTSTDIANRSGLGSVSIPSFSILVNNLLYYQIQFFIRALTGRIFPNGLMINIVFLIIFLVIVIFLLYHLIFSKKYRVLCCYMTACILLSFGVIGILILSKGGAVNMQQNADWTVHFTADHWHYFFCNIALFAMLFGTMGILRKSLKIIKVKKGQEQIDKIYALLHSVPLAILIAFCFRLAPSPYMGVYTQIEQAVTEWQKQWYITKNGAYYLPVMMNEAALALNIPLQQNSYGVLLGYDTAGNWIQLPVGSNGMDHSITYNSASVAMLEQNGILSLTTKKANTNFDTNYTMRIYDAAGSLLASVPQSNSDYREWITFLPDVPVFGADHIDFVFTDTEIPAPVCNALNIGILKAEA